LILQEIQYNEKFFTVFINENIHGGLSYLKDLKDQYGSTELALAAYNAGPEAVNKYGGIPPYTETIHYVQNIMSFYKYYKKNPDPAHLQVINQEKQEKQEKKELVNVPDVLQNDRPDPVKQNSQDNSPFGFLLKIWNFLT